MTAAPQHPSGRRKRLPHHLGRLTALGIALTACAAPPAPGSNPYLGWMEASSPRTSRSSEHNIGTRSTLRPIRRISRPWSRSGS